MYKFIFRSLVTLTFLASGYSVLHAQGQMPSSTSSEITGIVLDSLTKRPIEMATVSLSANGKVLLSMSSDQSGKFNFQIQDNIVYTISVSFMSYHTYCSKPLTGTRQLVIMLTGNAAALGEVVVKAKTPPLQYKNDKLVYNAGTDISNKTGSATDVLRKVPLLTVGVDGEVKLRGNSNIKVLLNGMPSGMMAKNLKEALKIIPASSIKSIEVITSPSAKYEAEGAAGIINIITKKAVKGTSGSVDLSGGNLEQSANAVLSINREKFDYSFNLNTSRNQLRTVSTLERTSFINGQRSGSLYQQNDATQYDRGTSAGLSLNYRPDNSQKIGAYLSYWRGSWPAKNSSYNRLSDATSLSEYNQRSRQSGLFNYYELALNYQKKMNKKDQELTIKAMIGRSDDRSDYLTNRFNLSGSKNFTEKGPNTGKNWDSDIQADYSHPLSRAGKKLLETGVRFTRASSQTAYEVYNNQSNPGSEQLDRIGSRSDAMDYFRNIYSGYVSLKLEAGKQWTIRPGLRFEGTAINSTFKSNQLSFSATFSNWVPNILIAKKLNDHHEFRFNYTERIRRPFIWDLNPYVNASDPRNLISGNPQLRPEKTRMLELGHAYNANSNLMLNSSIYYQFTNDAIESFTTVNAQGISLTTPSNVASSRRLGCNINAALELNKDWSINGGLELYRVWFKSPVMYVSNNGNFYSVNLNSSYTLSKAVTLQLSADYSNGFVTLQGRNTAYWNYRISVQKEFLNKRASALLSFNNPFQRALLQSSYATAPSFSDNATNTLYSRAFSVAFSWKFGSVKKQIDEQQVRNEEGSAPRRRGKY